MNKIEQEKVGGYIALLKQIVKKCPYAILTKKQFEGGGFPGAGNEIDLRDFLKAADKTTLDDSLNPVTKLSAASSISEKFKNIIIELPDGSKLDFSQGLQNATNQFNAIDEKTWGKLDLIAIPERVFTAIRQVDAAIDTLQRSLKHCSEEASMVRNGYDANPMKAVKRLKNAIGMAVNELQNIEKMELVLEKPSSTLNPDEVRQSPPNRDMIR